eukprot:scaffold9027_cov174-Amphora_coffeaeformis.AAC.7
MDSARQHFKVGILFYVPHIRALRLASCAASAGELKNSEPEDFPSSSKYQYQYTFVECLSIASWSGLLCALIVVSEMPRHRPQRNGAIVHWAILWEHLMMRDKKST